MLNDLVYLVAFMSVFFIGLGNGNSGSRENTISTQNDNPTY